MNSRSLLLLLLLLLPPLLLLPSYIVAQQAFSLVSCSNDAGNYTAGSTFRANLNTLLSSMAADDQVTSGFYNLSAGQAPDQANAIGLCWGDIGPDYCRDCITDATGRILLECPNQVQAIGSYDQCMIQFSNRSISRVAADGSAALHMSNPTNASDPTRFDAALQSLLARLRAAAASGSSGVKFATGTETQGAVTIYGLMQCAPDLSRQLCDDCLADATSEIPNCCGGSVGARVLKTLCNLRFETYSFYAIEAEADAPPPVPAMTPSPPSLGGEQGSKNTRRITLTVVPAIGGVFFIIVIVSFLCWKLKRSSKKGQKEGISRPEGSLQFNLEVIKVATCDFVDENKLGQGGFGAVYKGTLPNRQDIAVKRLAMDSGQGDLEFKNEVELVGKLQHRNLVKLLGFCMEGKERLLIYEFVPNASLDHFLFDPVRRLLLNWERRYNIIRGIARGLVYLHEESRLRIIHRDLKASNILLDAEMNPKISDFGLARLFDIDEIEGNTSRIVGTYGYMAPEYVMHGEFSMKSDVFSFGVLVLEIVSGQKRNLVRNGSSTEDLLSYAWRNWRNETYSNLVDPTLGRVSGIQMMRCIHIGLLCVQENVNHRPTMAAVALMLSSYLPTLPLPSKLAFVVVDSDDVGSLERAASWGYSTTSREDTDGAYNCSSTAGPFLFSRNDISITELYPR